MLGRLPEKLCRGNSEGAADARRTPASTRLHRANLWCSWVVSRCQIRTRRAAESRPRGTRVARDAVPTPAVVADRSASESLITYGTDDADLQAALGDFVGAGTSDTADSGVEQDDPNQLSPEQLENRRLSSRAASTSASAGFSTASLDGGVVGPRRPGGRGPQEAAAVTSRSLTVSSTVFPSFPNFPRPRAAAATPTASPGGPAGPLAPVQIPPEAAQLYAGSAIAGNLSATGGSADVLTPLLDALQLEPPGLPASNAQRVYRTAAAVAAEAAGAGGTGAEGGAKGAISAGGSTGAALPLLVRRKRARTRVLDTSELLLARDEAVRTELISRTWNDLLRFEERLSTAPASGTVTAGPAAAAASARGKGTMDAKAVRKAAAPTAVAAVPVSPTAAEEVQPAEEDQVNQPVSEPVAPSSLDDVLGFLQEAAVALKEQQLVGQSAEATQQRKVAQRSARLLGYIARARTWQRLAQLFLKHGRGFSVSHLVATLVGLARFDADGRVLRRRGRRKAFDLVWAMLTQRVVFAAPRMTGGQVVRVVRAIGGLPLRGSQRVEHSLITVQRVMRYSQHTMLQQATPAGGNTSSNGEANNGGGVILNVSQVAQRGGRGSRRGQKGKAVAVAAGTGAAAQSGRRQALLMGSSADADGGSVTMDGTDYAALCYTLGRMNSRARPWRKSLRLSPSVARRLLLGSYAQLSSLGPREVAGLLYGLGCMRLNPPAPWMYGFYVHSARWLPSMTDVQLTMVICGACRLKVKPPLPWIEAYQGATGPRLRLLDSAGLAAAVHSLGRLQYKPRHAWTEAFMASAREALASGGVQPGEMSQLARGMMFLGMRPPEDFLEALWEASRRAMEGGEFSAAQLANLAWALGSLKVATPRPWYDQLVHQVRKNYPQLRPYHRRRLLSALHAFGCRDLPRWYQLLGIPLEEMPGYASWSALQAKQRATFQAKAAKQGPAQAKQRAGPQAEAPEVEAPGTPDGAARVARHQKQRQEKAGEQPAWIEQSSLLPQQSKQVQQTQ